MRSELNVFDYEGNQIRVAKSEDGEPWFVGKDVCSILEIENPSNAYSRLDEDEKLTLRLPDAESGVAWRTVPGVMVSEPGLYKLILRSDKPKAKDFQRWVTHEVLPAIRKTGGYVAGEEKIYSDSSIHPSSPFLSRYSLAMRMISSFRVILSLAAWTLSHFNTG